MIVRPKRKDTPLAEAVDEQLPPGTRWGDILIYHRNHPRRGGGSSIDLWHADPNVRTNPPGALNAALPLLDELATRHRLLKLTGISEGGSEPCEIPYTFLWCDCGVQIRRDRIKENGRALRCFLDPIVSVIADFEVVEWVETQWHEASRRYRVKEDGASIAAASKALSRKIVRTQLRDALDFGYKRRGIPRPSGRPRKEK